MSGKIDPSVKVPRVYLKKMPTEEVPENKRLHIQAHRKNKSSAAAATSKANTKSKTAVSTKRKQGGAAAAAGETVGKKQKAQSQITNYFQAGKQTDKSQKQKAETAKSKSVNEKKSKAKEGYGDSSKKPYAVVKCPTCNRTMQMRSYDRHMQLHKEDKLQFTCLEESCGAQFQFFGFMQTHMRHIHNKNLTKDACCELQQKVRQSKKKDTAAATDQQGSRSKQDAPGKKRTKGAKESPKAQGRRTSPETNELVRGVPSTTGGSANVSWNSIPASAQSSSGSRIGRNNLCAVHDAPSGATISGDTRTRLVASPGGTQSIEIPISAILPQFSMVNRQEAGLLSNTTTTAALNADGTVPMLNLLAVQVPEAPQEGTEAEQLRSIGEVRFMNVAVQDTEQVPSQTTRAELPESNASTSNLAGENEKRSCKSDDKCTKEESLEEEHPNNKKKSRQSEKEEQEAEPSQSSGNKPGGPCESEIKQEPESADETGIDLVLEDYDTVIHLPKRSAQPNPDERGFSISFGPHGKSVHIKRRKPEGHNKSRSRIKTENVNEPIVILDNDDEGSTTGEESSTIVLID